MNFPDSLRPRHRLAPVPDGGFAVWAPHKQRVELHLDGTIHPMQRHDRGWWHSPVERVQGQRYGFLLTSTDAESGETTTTAPLPDPRSARLPDGVHELSQVHELDASRWTDTSWTGRPLAGQVIYEMHVGTFTPDGTLRSAIDRLDELVELGITVVELMPLASFDGPHGWGYDGVSWYSVHEAYGGPDALQDFVNAAHARGLGVYLDVVYNHFGPSGNYAPAFAPYQAAHSSLWGDAVNLDGRDSDDVRSYIIDNALRWLNDFHLDGLRLDAVHALHDETALHILEELSAAVDELSAQLGRPLVLIAETDRNDHRTVLPRAAHGLGIHGQWCDDVHHAIHARVSGERQGYYCDFGSLEALKKTLEQAFFHDGTLSTFRARVHGRPLDRTAVPGSAIVTYTCTHDQVGNRAAGDRPSQNLSPAQLIAKFALVACSPFTPMLFQGEEWGASTPFAFFASHTDPAVAEGTRKGRLSEFAAMGWDPETIADPMDPDTFRRSKLNWSERTREPHAPILQAYQQLLRLRRQQAELSNPRLDEVTVDLLGDQGIAMHRGTLRVLINLSDEPLRAVAPAGSSLLWSNASSLVDDTIALEPWGVAIVRRR